MDLQPAHVEQVRRGSDGKLVLISAEASTVAADLQAIDKGLKVRFAEAGNPPYWCVYHETHNPDGSTTHDLVLTQRASQNSFGVWEGLDERVVRRIREIDPRKGYDLAGELDRQNREAARRRRAKLSEVMGEVGERAAHATRKDLGARYKSRAFIDKKEKP